MSDNSCVGVDEKFFGRLTKQSGVLKIFREGVNFMATYIPRVLLCGDEKIFRKTIGDKPAEIVGRTDFAQAGDATTKLLDETAEYLIFTDAVDFALYLKNFPPTGRVMSAESFAKKIHDGFFSYDSLNDFYGLVRRKKIFGRVLDFDCYLAKNDFKTASNGGGVF